MAGEAGERMSNQPTTGQKSFTNCGVKSKALNPNRTDEIHAKDRELRAV